MHKSIPELHFSIQIIQIGFMLCMRTSFIFMKGRRHRSIQIPAQKTRCYKHTAQDLWVEDGLASFVTSDSTKNLRKDSTLSLPGSTQKSSRVKNSIVCSLFIKLTVIYSSIGEVIIPCITFYSQTYFVTKQVSKYCIISYSWSWSCLILCGLRRTCFASPGWQLHRVIIYS